MNTSVFEFTSISFLHKVEGVRDGAELREYDQEGDRVLRRASASGVESDEARQVLVHSCQPRDLDHEDNQGHARVQDPALRLQQVRVRGRIRHQGHINVHVFDVARNLVQVHPLVRQHARLLVDGVATLHGRDPHRHGLRDHGRVHVQMPAREQDAGSSLDHVSKPTHLRDRAVVRASDVRPVHDREPPSEGSQVRAVVVHRAEPATCAYGSSRRTTR